MNVIPHRLFAVNPDGSRIEIDLVLPGSTVRKKEGLDAFLYLLAAKAGIGEIDSDFDPHQLGAEIRARLAERGLDPDGMQPIVALHPDGTKGVIGQAVTGVLPFYRPVQTGFSQFKVKSGERGIKVQTHAMLMAGEVEFDIPVAVKAEFAQTVECRRQVKGIRYERESVYAVEEDFVAA